MAKLRGTEVEALLKRTLKDYMQKAVEADKLRLDDYADADEMTAGVQELLESVIHEVITENYEPVEDEEGIVEWHHC